LDTARGADVNAESKTGRRPITSTAVNRNKMKAFLAENGAVD